MRLQRDYVGYACIMRPATPVLYACDAAYRDRHFASGYVATEMPERKDFALKAVALSTVRMGRSLRRIEQKFCDYVPSAREHGGSKASYGSTGKESCPLQPFTRFCVRHR